MLHMMPTVDANCEDCVFGRRRMGFYTLQNDAGDAYAFIDAKKICVAARAGLRQSYKAPNSKCQFVGNQTLTVARSVNPLRKKPLPHAVSRWTKGQFTYDVCTGKEEGR